MNKWVNNLPIKKIKHYEAKISKQMQMYSNSYPRIPWSLILVNAKCLNNQVFKLTVECRVKSLNTIIVLWYLKVFN